jgi:Na+-driven multidrug efflux pump
MRGPGSHERLEKGSLPGLLASYCLPSLVSSLIIATYNIVDQLFIGNALGVVGNAATNVVFPMVTLLTALSLMTGVGASAAMNLSLGRGDAASARRAVGNSLALAVICGAAMTAAMLLFTKPLLHLFGCTPAVEPLAVPYGRITCLSFVAAIIGAAGPFIIRADGGPGYALACSAAGAVLNVVLDAILIFGLGLGIEGAAWATVAGQGLSAAMVLMRLPRLRSLRLSAADFSPSPRLLGRLSALGAGPMLNFLTQALTQIFLNDALRAYGADSVYGSEACLAAAGVANKVGTVVVAIVTGLTNGMQPIVSYNHGRGNRLRVLAVARAVVTSVLAASIAIFLCYQLAPVFIVSWFGPGSDAYFEFAAAFFRIFLLFVAFNGLLTSVGGVFTAQGRPGWSILLSVTRQVLFLPPLLILLPRRLGLTGVLWAGPVADLAMAALALTLLRREFASLERGPAPPPEGAAVSPAAPKTIES